MRALPLVLCAGLLGGLAGGCARTDSEAPRATTSSTTAARPTTTTTAPAPAPEARATGTPRPRHGPLRPLRPQRLPRQALRAALAAEIAARRPDRPLPPGELERVTNLAMQIRVLRGRRARMRPGREDTPRAQFGAARLERLLAEFQTRAGVSAADLSHLLDPAAG